MMKKVDCYKCRWRANCEGSAHSQCCHPYNKPILDDPMVQMFSIFASVGRVEPVALADSRLKIKGNAFGIKKGWFNYPCNFDPVWLENCDGFEESNPDDPRILNECKKPEFCYSCEDRFKCYTKDKVVNDGI